MSSAYSRGSPTKPPRQQQLTNYGPLPSLQMAKRGVLSGSSNEIVASIPVPTTPTTPTTFPTEEDYQRLKDMGINPPRRRLRLKKLK